MSIIFLFGIFGIILISIIQININDMMKNIKIVKIENIKRHNIETLIGKHIINPSNLYIAYDTENKPIKVQKITSNGISLVNGKVIRFNALNATDKEKLISMYVEPYI